VRSDTTLFSSSTCFVTRELVGGTRSMGSFASLACDLTHFRSIHSREAARPTELGCFRRYRLCLRLFLRRIAGRRVVVGIEHGIHDYDFSSMGTDGRLPLDAKRHTGRQLSVMRRIVRPVCSDATSLKTVALWETGISLVEVLLRKVPDCFCRPFLNLGLYLRCGSGVIHDDAELVIMDEEATGYALSVGIEGDGLNGQVTNVSADHNTNKTQ
jgi:hypothetical protein